MEDQEKPKMPAENSESEGSQERPLGDETEILNQKGAIADDLKELGIEINTEN